MEKLNLTLRHVKQNCFSIEMKYFADFKARFLAFFVFGLSARFTFKICELSHDFLVIIMFDSLSCLQSQVCRCSRNLPEVCLCGEGVSVHM